MGSGSRRADEVADRGEEPIDLELGDIVDRSSETSEDGTDDLAHGSDISALDGASSFSRTATPHDLQAILQRYLLDLDETVLDPAAAANHVAETDASDNARAD